MAKTVLFQGDSITDAGRDREGGWYLGHGYPALIASSLGLDCPGDYNFVNKGVGGNRILDVYARIVCRHSQSQAKLHEFVDRSE